MEGTYGHNDHVSSVAHTAAVAKDLRTLLLACGLEELTVRASKIRVTLDVRHGVPPLLIVDRRLVSDSKLFVADKPAVIVFLAQNMDCVIVAVIARIIVALVLVKIKAGIAHLQACEAIVPL